METKGNFLRPRPLFPTARENCHGGNTRELEQSVHFRSLCSRTQFIYIAYTISSKFPVVRATSTAHESKRRVFFLLRINLNSVEQQNYAGNTTHLDLFLNLCFFFLPNWNNKAILISIDFGELIYCKLVLLEVVTFKKKIIKVRDICSSNPSRRAKLENEWTSGLYICSARFGFTW